MAGKLDIVVTDKETGKSEKIETDGLLIMYMEGEKIRMIGRMDMKVLSPILMRIALEKLTK